MKLTQLQWEALNDALSILSNRMEINISVRTCRTYRGREVRFGVNWSACGVQSPEDTLVFAQKLKEAAEITKMLQDMDITYQCDNVEPEMTDEDYDKYVPALAKALEYAIESIVVDVLDKFV